MALAAVRPMAVHTGTMGAYLSPPLLEQRHTATRRLGICCDDVGAAQSWRQAVAGEGLQLVDLPAPQRSIDVDALVLFLSRGLADQLGRLRELVASHRELPIVVVCRGLRELDHVLALEMGAAEVLDASQGAAVVAARLRALWRRAAPLREPVPAPTTLRFGPLVLQHAERTVELDAVPIELTEGEFEVLWLLALRAGQPVSRCELLRQLRGLDEVDLDRSIDSRVYRIRAKLGDHAGRGQRIRTIRNCGYLFAPTNG